MIEHRTGDIFESGAQVLVNAVNCVGIMGKGLALAFKIRYLGMYTNYKRACTSELLFPGAIHCWANSKSGPPEWIVNFPTKEDWRNKSKIEYIQKGLPELTRFVRSAGIQSIAIPPLGCGLGGLQWDAVRPLIEKAFEPLPGVHVYLYGPTSQ